MEKKLPSLNMSIFVIGVSLLVMIIGIIFLKLSSEVLLCLIAMFAAIAAMRLGYKWQELEDAIAERMGRTVPVLLLIWIIGMIVGSFIYSGTIPMIIYYGLIMIDPSWVIFSAFVMCIIFSVATGSSWSSAGTVGVAFIGVAQGLGVPLHITAGAIITGSIFGDKLSPLSETTNLAPLCAGAKLYDHIKAMLWTTLPPTIIAGVVYILVGSKYAVQGGTLPESTMAMINGLDSIYKWNIILLIPFAIIIFGGLTKKPPVPTLFISVLSALAIGFIYQGFPLTVGFKSVVNGFSSSSVYTGELAAPVLSLLNRGGMKSMVSVILIVFCGYSFAAIVSKAGFLDRICEPIVGKINTSSQLILATLATVLFIFVATGNAYIAFILVPEIYRKKYAEMGIAPMVLSRSLEDIGTVFGALLPWSSSAAFYITTLGVSIYGAGGYALWSIMSYLSPLFAVLCAITGIGVYKLSKEAQKEAIKQLENSI